MLMQRLQTNNTTPPDTSTAIPSHTNIIKMRLLGKDATTAAAAARQQQQQHVSSLITTAATGAGIVGDVDALLTPMPVADGSTYGGSNCSGSASSSSGSSGGGANNSASRSSRNDSTRPERNLWNRREMVAMLQIMHETNSLDLLNDKTIKSETVFRKVEELMNAKGLCKKSHVQIWTKWKFLKSTYNTTKRNGTVPKMIPGEVYQMLCKMLDGSSGVGNNSSIAGSDCGNSLHSMLDGDTSNGDAADTNEVGQRISFEANEINTVSNKAKDDLGIAHPIFGYRLGPIKPEPVDTGYETVGQNDISSEQDPLDHYQSSISSRIKSTFQHTPFSVEVKQELEEDTPNTPPPTAPASPTPPASSVLFSQLTVEHTALNDEQRSFHRHNGKQPIVTSTPQGMQLPPLRVAQFAKEPTPSSGVFKIECPSSLHSTSSSFRQARTHNASANATQSTARLMLPKIPAQSASHTATATAVTTTTAGAVAMPYTYMRLPKDISVQSAARAANATANPTSMLRLKQIPMRQTPYSLRPERKIPNLDQSISPPPSPVPANTAVQQHQQQHQHQPAREVPTYPTYIPGCNNASTSRQTQFQTFGKERKRRLAFNGPNKPLKFSRTPNFKLSSDFSSSRIDDDNDEDKDVNDNEEWCDGGYARCNKQNLNLEHTLNALADALRRTQCELMQDFFAQQKETARREHEFQIKQDLQLMRAFRKQTEQLFVKAKNYLGIDLSATSDDTVRKEAEQQQTTKSPMHETKAGKGKHEQQATSRSRRSQYAAAKEDELHCEQAEYLEDNDADDDDDAVADDDDNESHEAEADSDSNYSEQDSVHEQRSVTDPIELVSSELNGEN